MKKVPKKYDRLHAIRAYMVVIAGRANTEEKDHFIAFFNWLIEREWSLSGLRFIKDNAWRRLEG